MGKRGNGEGSVSTRPRADGLWVARYTLVEDGVRRRPAVYGKTRGEASRKLRAALVARDEELKSGRQSELPPSSAPLSQKYVRIADQTRGAARDVWIHRESIESLEANDNDQTIVRLRSGRTLLVDRHIDAALEDLGHEHSSAGRPPTSGNRRAMSRRFHCGEP